MAGSLFVYNEPGLGQGTETATAGYARRLAQHLLEAAPFLSIESTTSDTTTLYDVTLAVSFDEATKLRIYNSSAAYYASTIFNGTAVLTFPQQLPTVANTGTIDTYICTGTNFLFFMMGINGGEPNDAFGMFLGQVVNSYDEHVSTVFNARPSFYGGSYFSWNANGTKYTGGSYVTAFPTPYTNWGGAGHLYGAVPLAFSLETAAAPIIGFVGGSDSIYTIYDNGSRLDVPPGTTFTIDGHKFFCFVTNTNTASSYRVLTAVRLS